MIDVQCREWELHNINLSATSLRGLTCFWLLCLKDMVYQQGLADMHTMVGAAVQTVCIVSVSVTGFSASAHMICATKSC